MKYQDHYADYKWIKVKRYQVDETKSWEEKYRDLEEHHLKETTFLIDEVRALAKELDDDKQIIKGFKDEEWWKERIMTFFTMWGGSSISIILILNLFMDRQTQLNNGWLFPVIMGSGLVLSGLFCWYKYAYSKRV